MAVVAGASGRFCSMLRVIRHIRSKRRVTLQARVVAVHPRDELSVGPLVKWTRVARQLMHGVTREAGQSLFHIRCVLETRRLDEAVVFAARDSHAAVRPK